MKNLSAQNSLNCKINIKFFSLFKWLIFQSVIISFINHAWEFLILGWLSGKVVFMAKIILYGHAGVELVKSTLIL